VPHAIHLTTFPERRPLKKKRRFPIVIPGDSRGIPSRNGEG